MQEDERLKMGTCARQKALEKYDWQHHVNEIISAIQK